MERELTWGGDHPIQYTGDVLQNCTLEIYTTLLTNVNTMNSIKIQRKIKA